MKILLIAILFFPLVCLAQTEDDFVARIDAQVAEADRRADQYGRDFVLKKRLKNRKTVNEEWYYSNFKGRLEYLAISHRIGNTVYSESYYLHKGKLFFADEGVTLYFDYLADKDDISSFWSGSYYFDDRKMLKEVIYGHGKSEVDGWDPEKETLQRLSARLKQLRRKLKAKK